jgi:hypothetical protein
MQVSEHQLGGEKDGRSASNSAWGPRFSLQALRRTLEDGEKIGSKKPSGVIVPRLFPSGSPILSFTRNTIEDMAENTSVRCLVIEGRPGLFESENEEVLLLVGDLDGNGKVVQSSENLKKSWDEALADVEEGEEDGRLICECR